MDCGPAFGTYLVRRAELLSSNAADVSVNTVPDSTGHRMGVSGAIVIERLEYRDEAWFGEPRGTANVMAALPGS